VNFLVRQTVTLEIVDMFGKSIFLLVVMAKLASGRDDLSSVRAQEDALAKAVNTKDKAGLLTLTDKLFHVSWECGSAVRNFTADVLRQDWINDVSQLRANSYKANISDVHFVRALGVANNDARTNKSMASVTVNEF
jgi:hypothetical protein